MTAAPASRTGTAFSSSVAVEALTRRRWRSACRTRTSARCRTPETQKQYIEARAAARGLTYLEVITAAERAGFPGAPRSTRVVSVEMFEPMARYFFTRRNDAKRVALPAHQRRLLANMNARRREIIPLLEGTYGEAGAPKWWVYWRVFFMACELWGFRGGREWLVSHDLFEKSAAAEPRPAPVS